MKAKDVVGFMIDEQNTNCGSNNLNIIREAFNRGVREQGNQEITFNRDKLAQTIFGYERMGDKLNDMLPHVVAKYLRLADAIIAAEADIIESPIKDEKCPTS